MLRLVRDTPVDHSRERADRSDADLWHELRDNVLPLFGLAKGSLAGPIASGRIQLHDSEYSFHCALLTLDATDRVPVIVLEPAQAAVPSEADLQAQFRLTRREAQVAARLALRRSNREIAQELSISTYTARRHTEKVLLKVGVKGRADVSRAILNAAG